MSLPKFVWKQIKDEVLDHVVRNSAVDDLVKICFQKSQCITFQQPKTSQSRELIFERYGTNVLIPSSLIIYYQTEKYHIRWTSLLALSCTHMTPTRWPYSTSGSWALYSMNIIIKKKKQNTSSPVKENKFKISKSR